MDLHPLEPLSSLEVMQAVSILKVFPSFTPTTRIICISLREPKKSLVFAWEEGQTSRREADAVLFDNAKNATSTARIDLSANKLIEWKPAAAGVQPTLSMDEQVECEKAVLASAEFLEALERHHGITDSSLVMVDIWSAGNYGSEEDRSRRLTRPLCFLRSSRTDNGYARPIESIRPVVDLNLMQVIRVEEYGDWPLPPTAGNYSTDHVENFRSDIKPLLITQLDGPSFSLTGNQLNWQNWNLVVGFNAREGLTIHDVRYSDKGRKRPILYRASLTEMVVPYGDPRPTQVRKNAFDVGEYGMGMCANSLKLGCDCVGHIAYLDGELCDSRGGRLTIPNAICIHEEDFGILWKHTDRRLPDSPEVRRSRRLVVSSMSTVENYEYGFFWYFYQDGNIQFEVKLTGILSLGAVREGEIPKHGTVIAPLLYAPNHQHFFNMRLDFSIDGIANTVQQIDVVADPVDESNAYENAFHARATNLTTEQQALANLNLDTSRVWKVVNPSVTNANGAPVGYKFFPGDNAIAYASSNAWWRKRAGFVDHHVWVTPYREEERYAAGDYPNQSGEGDGLIRWTRENRSIENQDIVFWYTFGHTHIPRNEDYPVMPTAYIGFLLKPNGFFDLNPANDVPPSTPAKREPVCRNC
jgi:primary-amine oxidase